MIKVPDITTKLTIIIPEGRQSAATIQKRDNFFRVIGLIITYLLIVFAALIVIFPFYYMIAASFMSEAELKTGSFFPLEGNLWENMIYNYTQTLLRFNYGRYVTNTLIVGLCTTCGSLVITILAAFAFSRLRFRGRDALFAVFLATMMIPGEMMIISNYTTMSNFGLISSSQTTAQAYLVMILPFLASVFYIYLLRQNFKQIPNELYLAAKVDGKSDWTYLWQVMVPLSSPTLITIFILNLIGSWNAYVWPNMVTSNQNNWLISVAIRSSALTLEDHEVWITQNSWTMAATVLTVVPLLVLFIIFRKYIMRGAGRAGIKG
jgi:multiple sugar transport system permease protein